MQEIIDAFLTYGSVQKGWSKSTISGKRYHLRQLGRWYQETYGRAPELSDLTKDVCQQWIVILNRTTLAPSTRYAAVCVIRSIGEWAVEQGLIPTNPGTTIKLPKLYALTQKSCSNAEKEALLDAALRRMPKAKRPLAAALIATFVYTGLRRFELCALDVEDIAWDGEERRAKLIVKKGKGNKHREVPINSELAQYLRAWLEVRKAPRAEPALWIGLCGKRLSDYLLGQLLEDVKTAAGLEGRDNLTPHGFRHYFASELDRRGVPLAEIQALLGHATIQTTLSYLQCDREKLYDAVEVLTHKSVPTPALEPKRSTVKVAGDGPRRSIRLRMA